MHVLVSIAAASIIAKVYRDDLMKQYDKLYPGYGFDHNAGYGTKKHLLGLAEGVTPIIGKTFAPVKCIRFRNLLPLAHVTYEKERRSLLCIKDN